MLIYKNTNLFLLPSKIGYFYFLVPHYLLVFNCTCVKSSLPVRPAYNFICRVPDLCNEIALKIVCCFIKCYLQFIRM